MEDELLELDGGEGSQEQDPELSELIQAVEPIRGLIKSMDACESSPGVYSLDARMGGGQVEVRVMVQLDLLTVDFVAGYIPPTAENYATLLAQHQEGPWWFRIDDDTYKAVVIRMCNTHRRDLARLDQLMLEAWREYWSVQPLLEVLNGTFYRP
ncbi:hypothetical protein DKM44_14405 [Deinococcus irradiatisoli]|uniref:YbjN domain-containing protein n=1 Tax=Deinococcus irradiatisoli TaxID=2202254 RepID=A0A2Z3JGI4_9DEIO|nr:hypothetical protein [Deinococcus irradiatisoli]AWN24273.1 hypothetical protein DKM44_14405 [Deinococcus irradiatisoli]